MKTLIKTLLEKTFKTQIRSFELQKLCEHASYRAYYRVSFQIPSPLEGEGVRRTGEGPITLILMQMPAGASSVSEEITNYQGKKEELPFINIQRYLSSLGLPIPKIYAWDEENKLMLLEDVGDQHLELYLKDASPELRISFYKRAIDLLVEMQKKTSFSPSPQPSPARGEGVIAFARNFDETLLNWEFDHFLEYGIEDRFKIKIPESEKKVFTEITRQISKEIAASPYIFVHRDFQSRNLMMKDYQLYILDFQDALLGPQTYDLVSLTRDSYIELSPEAVEKLIDYFLEARKKAGIEIQNTPAFKKLFYQNTLQRKLKDTGRFQFINTVKGNPSFLVSVPSSLRYVKQAFEKLPEYEELGKWIAGYVGELH
ncbi:MAG: phosphotransferase [Deltaproteobacteria bacterium]|nr:phosphotransferase [Deltaproteobacteria bacterium]